MRAAGMMVVLALGLPACRGAPDVVLAADEAEAPEHFAYALATGTATPDFPVPLPSDAKVLQTIHHREELAGSTIPPRTLDRHVVRLLTTIARDELRGFYRERFPGLLRESIADATDGSVLLHRNPAGEEGAAEVEILISDAIDGATQVVEIVHTRELPIATTRAELMPAGM